MLGARVPWRIGWSGLVSPQLPFRRSRSAHRQESRRTCHAAIDGSGQSQGWSAGPMLPVPVAEDIRRRGTPTGGPLQLDPA